MAAKVLVSDPVNAINGNLYEIVDEFSFPTDFPFAIFRKYGSDFDFSCGLGSGYITPLDVFIVDGGYNRYLRKEIIYRDANGLFIHFNKPLPIPGGWEFNKKHKNLKIIAGANRTLILQEGRIERLFKKYPDGVWRLEKQSAYGQELLFERRKDGFLLKLHHPGGLSLVFHEHANGLRAGYDLVTKDGEQYPLMRYSYDAEGRLETAINPHGEDRFYQYDEKGRRVSWSNGISQGRHFFDDEGRVTRVETNGPYNNDTFVYKPEEGISEYLIDGKESQKTEYIYRKGEALDTIRNAIGAEERFEYDDSGQQIRNINGEGEATSTSYDIYGYERSIRDGEGRETYYVSSSEGDLLQIIPPGAHGWQFAYDEMGHLTQVINPEGIITEFKNNDRGQTLAVMRHDGLLEQRQYDEHDRLVAVSDFRGAVTRLSYDKFGRIITVQDAKGAVTKLGYQPQKGASFWEPATIIRPDGVELSRRYEQNAHSVKMRDGEGREVTYRYGSFELLEAIEDAKGGKLGFSYDGQERLISVINQLGQTWTFERDAIGRVIKETDFSGLIQRYSYDKADRLVETLYSDDTRLTFAYDKSGLLIKERVFGADGALQDETIYQYDEMARLKYTENNSAVVAFKYDKLGRIISETLNGREVKSSYDCCGNRTRREIGGRLVEMAYDPLGVLKSLAIGTHQPLTMQLDPLGRELRRESAAGFKLEQTFDVLGQLTRQVAGLSIGSLGKGFEGLMAAQQQNIAKTKADTQVDRHYSWNKSFEPLNIADKRWGETAYSYDANGQIGETTFGDGTSERFKYDSAMNINAFGDASAQKFEPWLGEQGGRITEAKGPNGERIALKYDERRRVIERKVTRNGFRVQVWRYQWDAKDRLIATITPDGERWTYAYDPFGRRIFKINAKAAQAALLAQSSEPTEEEKNRGAYYEERTRRGSHSEAAKSIVGTTYLWDGHVIAEEAPMLADGSADWDKATRWHYEPDSFRPIAKETASGELLYIVNDHLGTPREMFSEDGHLVWAAQYRTWGGLKKVWRAENDNDARGPYPPVNRGNLAVKYETVEALAAQDCPIRFQGQWEDAETGLYYNRYRYYDPLAGQYLSPDPIGLAGGLRSQGYVENPSAWIDPWGLAKKCCSEVAEDIVNRAREGMRKQASNYHGDKHGFTPEMELEILKNPDGIYSMKNGNFVFHKGGDVVITKGPGAGWGNVVTAYGSSGIKGESGVAALGGLATDRGQAITAEMITSGRIPTKNGFMSPGIPIK